MQLTGSQILVEVLVEESVDTIFGYPGGAVLNIYDELYRNQHRIRHITTAHEQGASHAADGYARATGKTGVVLATSGPGATNLVTGIATAYMDSVPMVAITGNVSTDLLGWDSFQEVYITGITMPITKHNFVVRRVEDLADTLREAFRIAASDRPGPVLVDIPKDITAAKCEFTPKTPVKVQKHWQLDAAQLQNAAQLLNEAKRPVIFFGGGVVSGGAADLVQQLMHKADIPACYTIMGTGALEGGDPLNLGLIGMHGFLTAGRAVKEADVVLALATRFSDRVATDKHHFAEDATIIHVDIDAAEINKNVLVDYSLVGDVGQVLEMLLPHIARTQRPQWRQRIETFRAEDYHPTDDDSCLKPHQIMGKISEITGEDAILVTDVGQHQMWAAQYSHRNRMRSFITSGGLGTMGYGYGASIGAQIGQPDRRVVHITGDGSFHMNLNELCTSVSYHLPIITVVMNNQVLGMVRQWQTVFYGQRYSCTDLQRKTDFAAVAEAFGARGFRCENLAQLDEALRQAVADGGPCVIDCHLDKDEKVLPMIPAGKTLDDVMVD
ncbi:MAG: biosynthetic-type acetolactate synthase large subunit [Eubacteriales bacterium]